MIYKVCSLFFIFTLFSVGGWIMETLLYLIRDKKAVKRGFLFGPVTPIYGAAAVICDLVIYQNIDKLYPDKPVINILLIFVIGFFISFVLEYTTHFVMEKLFHAMWWDYSGRKFNLNGRVYLNGLLIFGAGVVLIVKLLLPAIYKLIGFMPMNVLYWVSFFLYSIFLIDLAMTVADLAGSIRYIKNMWAAIVSETQKGLDFTGEQLDEFKQNITESEAYKKLVSDNPVVDRFKKRFLRVNLEKYKFLTDIIINNPDESRARHDIKLYGTAETAPVKEEEKADE